MDEPKQLRDGRYELVRKLGEGSQGETYEAIDRGKVRRSVEPVTSGSLAHKWERYLRDARGEKKAAASSVPPPEAGALVAIKCFRVGKAKAWKDVELAEREARTLASLDHPRLPKYIEHFEEDGSLYLVMEKIEGESLAAIRARSTSSPDEVIRMIKDIADALRYLHGRSPFIVHRDIKPGNILRRPDGSYALVDFGAVRDRLKTGGGSTVVGTFGYMAPEQFQGRASPKSDVYGVAATALAMLTGEEPEDLPHEGLGLDVARAVPRSTPAPLVRMLAAMLVPDPDRRVASIDEALVFLEWAPATTAAPAPKTKPGRKRNRKEERAFRKIEERAAKHERRLVRDERRKLRAARAAPLIPRLVGRLGLLVAWLVVWLVLGIVLPAALAILSLVFGSALRRAASACVRGARRAQARLGGASRWLSGEEPEREEEARVRIATELSRVKAVTPEDAQRIAIAQAEARGEDADAWLEERLARETQRWEEQEARDERMRRHARPPPKGKHWGR